MNYRLLLLIPSCIVLLLTTTGCTDADRAALNAYGDEHVVELYSGGQKVREWQSTGKVFSEENSDGFYFKDSDSGQLVRVTGNVVVTPLLKGQKKSGNKPVAAQQYQAIPANVDAGGLFEKKDDGLEESAALPHVKKF